MHQISTPCSAITAMSSAQAGDTIYFRGGQYEVGQSTGSWPPSFAGTSRTAHGRIPNHVQGISGRKTGCQRTGVRHQCRHVDREQREHTASRRDQPVLYHLGWVHGPGQQRRQDGDRSDHGEIRPADTCTVKNFIFNGGWQQVNDGNNWEGFRVERVKDLPCPIACSTTITRPGPQHFGPKGLP